MNEKLIENYLDKQIQYIRKLVYSKDSINMIYQSLVEARDNQKKIYIMGNGGSSSTASHFTSDLLKTSILKNKKRFKAFSLSDNMPVISAWSNDSSYEHIFQEQLENFLDKGDVVIAISGSGNSKNILNAIEHAKKFGALTISLTGKDGGKLAKISQINLNIEEEDMLSIETGHLLICHLLTTMLRSDGEPLFSY